MVKSRGPFFSILLLGVFCIFLKGNCIPLSSYVLSGYSLSFIYLTKAVLICRKFSSILTLYVLPDQNRIQGEECHTLRSKTLEIKNLSTLAGTLLIRGTMGYHFLLSLFFCQVDTEVPLILLPDTCLFFLRGCRALAPFYFLEIFIFLHSPCL